MPTAQREHRRGRRSPLALAGLVVTALLAVLVVNPVLSLAAGGKADYSLSVSPTSQTVQHGKSVAFTVSLSAVNGFTSPVDLTAGALPTGVTASFGKTRLDMSQGSQQSTTLTLSAARTAELRTSDITVNATSGRTVRSAVLTLTVEKAPGSLSLSVGPATATAVPGGTAVYDVTINRAGRYSDVSVALTASGLPSGATATFTPQTTTGTSSHLQIAVPGTARDASHTVTVTGTVGSGTTAETVTATTTLVVSDSSRSFTITGGATTALAPGLASPVALTLTNPNHRPLSVTNLTVAVAGVTPASGRTCDVSNYGMLRQYTGAYPISVPANGSVSLPGDPTTWPQLRMLETGTNQDGCKGASVSLQLTGSGQGE